MSPTREEWFRAKEADNTAWLDKDQYQIIRVDGRAFHTFTRKMKFDKPMDRFFMDTMNLVARDLCEEIQGAKFAYVQSDEISVLTTSFGAKSQMWFGGQLRKWLSISAGIASARMTREWETPVIFDSRVLSLTERNDAIRYFLWRQSDCMRNAIQATAQYHAGHKNILGKDRKLQLQAIEAAGFDYSTMPQGWRNGRTVTPHMTPMLVSYTHKKTGEQHVAQVERNFWEVSDAPFFDWDQAAFLDQNIPNKA